MPVTNLIWLRCILKLLILADIPRREAHERHPIASVLVIFRFSPGSPIYKSKDTDTGRFLIQCRQTPQAYVSLS